MTKEEMKSFVKAELQKFSKEPDKSIIEEMKEIEVDYRGIAV